MVIWQVLNAGCFLSNFGLRCDASPCNEQIGRLMLFPSWWAVERRNGHDIGLKGSVAKFAPSSLEAQIVQNIPWGDTLWLQLIIDKMSHLNSFCQSLTLCDCLCLVCRKCDTDHLCLVAGCWSQVWHGADSLTCAWAHVDGPVPWNAASSKFSSSLGGWQG